MANPETARFGTLLLRVVVEGVAPTADRATFIVSKLSLVATDEVALVRERLLDLDLKRKTGTTFSLFVPVGRYRLLRLTARRDGQMAESDALVEIKIDVAISPDHPLELTLAIDTKALQPKLVLKGFVRVVISPPMPSGEAVVPASGPTVVALQVDLPPGSLVPRLDARPGHPPSMSQALIGSRVHGAAVRLEVPQDALKVGTRVVVRVLDIVVTPEGSPAPGGLPPLFRRQRAVGPVVEVTATAALGGFAMLTLPYDETAAAAAGVALDDLVVLTLDDRRTLYRELRPIAVDRGARTVTVRSSSFSFFFVGTSGIGISQPTLRRDAAGRASAWSSGSVATIAGRAEDERARAALFDATNGAPLPAASSWQAQGWFDFEGVPLRARGTEVRVRAEVVGLVPHEGEFSIRGNPPPKRITDPSRHYGPRLAVTTDDVPLVTAVIAQQNRFTDLGLVPPLDAWQRNWDRHGPYIYRPIGDGTSWEWRSLLPELHFEEQTARRAIPALSGLINIPLLPGLPEDRRALGSIAAQIGAVPSDDPSVGPFRQILDVVGREFGVGTMSLSPSVPVVAQPGGGFGAAFVAATVDGNDAANASRLRTTLERLYRSLNSPTEAMRRVGAGRLFFASGTFEDGSRQETVADGVWCATLQLRLDPAHGRPVIAALEPAPDAGDQPRSRLVLFRRSADGAWSREVVRTDAFVDFDFWFTARPAAGNVGTEVQFVTASAGQTMDIKTHLQNVFRDLAGWLGSPIEYETPWNRDFVTDMGLWPRVHVDASGRTALVFALFSAGAVTWLVSGSPGGVPRVEVVGDSSHQQLLGSPLPPATQGLRFDSPVNTSNLSLAHWAPSLAPAPGNALWCAFGNGVLNLARIDLTTLQSSVQAIDVDRMTGFFPALAARKALVPAVAYKDPWGPGEFGADAHDDLFFFSLEQGNVVPPAELPLAPPQGRGQFSIAALAPHVALDCGALASTDPRAILASVLLHRPFDIVLIPPEGVDPLIHTRISHAHSGFAAQLARLHRRSTVLALTIVNRDFPGEDIEAIEIGTFPDSIGTIPRSEIAQLDRRVMTATALLGLMNTGMRLSHTFPTIRVRESGRAWDIVDPDAYSGGLQQIGQTYLLRDTGNEIEIRLPPVITVIDRAGRRDELTNQPTPCGLTAQDWDEFAQPLADRLNIIQFPVPDVPGRLLWITARGIRVSRVAPQDPPIAQQGGVRITIEMPHFYASVEGPDAFAFSTESSFIHFTLAPFVQDGHIDWWPRESEVRVGHIEVDVEFGFFDWLAVIVSLIPGLGFVFLALDAAADSIATSDVNDDLSAPGTGNLQNLLLDVMRHITTLHGATQPTPLEAAWLHAMSFTTYWRSAASVIAERPAEAALNVFPSPFIGFGSVIAGGAPIRRNMLITSDGGVPSSLEQVRVRGAGEFSIVSPPTWPQVLQPGTSESVELAFTPNRTPGFRTDAVEVVFNNARRVEVQLHAVVQAPPEPLLRLRPEMVQFGVVTVGSQARREVEIFNDGRAPLEIAAPQLLAPGVAAGILTLETVVQLTVPPGGSGVVALRYSPPFGGPASVAGSLVLNSNDPARPRAALPVTGFAASGQMMVSPGAVSFPNSPIGANLPQLPPGLPPTLHRGPTRAVSVFNVGATSLTILGASFRVITAGVPSPHFRLWRTDGAALPPADTVVRAGDSLIVVIEFFAAVAGNHTGQMEFRSSDPSIPVARVSIQGVAV